MIKVTLFYFSLLIDRLQALVKHSPSFTMVDPVEAPIHKISEKQRRNVSRNSRYKRLDMSRRERVLARKKNHTHSWCLKNIEIEECNDDVSGSDNRHYWYREYRNRNHWLF